MVISAVTWDYLAYRIRAVQRSHQHRERLHAFISGDRFRQFYQTQHEDPPGPTSAAQSFGHRRIADVSALDNLRRERLQQLMERVALPAPRRHLDLGCKDGAVSSIFHGTGIELLGIDLHFAALKGFVSHLCGHGIQADVTHVPFRDGTMDTVSLLEVIEHLQDPLAALTEIRRVLRPNGMLLLSTNNRSTVLVDYLLNPLILLERCLGLYFPCVLPPAAMLWENARWATIFHTEFSRTELIALLHRAGLAPLIIETYFFLGGLDRWLARLYPTLTEACYARVASRVEAALAHFPLLRWLGGNWLIVAQPLTPGPSLTWCNSRI